VISQISGRLNPAARLRLNSQLAPLALPSAWAGN